MELCLLKSHKIQKKKKKKRKIATRSFWALPLPDSFNLYFVLHCKFLSLQLLTYRNRLCIKYWPKPKNFMVVDSKVLSMRNIMDERSVVSLCPSVSLCLRVSCIQNLGIFRAVAYSKPEVYWKPCQTSTTKRFAKIVHGYNYFRNISFSRSENIICFFKYWSNFYSRSIHSM